MYPDIIAISIPFLVASVAVEWLYDRKQKTRQYVLNRSISNISCGIAEQVTGFLSKGLFLVLYAALYANFRVYEFSDSSVWTWLLLIVLVDVIFYFYHRSAHRHGVLWAGHMIHHEVEEFNLTVALRRSVLQEIFIIPTYLPLAILGFSPGAFFLIFAAHNLYQFWIHTPYLPEFRWLGYVFNTAHHHVVHHCRNPRYVDRNFAGVFIIWDKMFGTFEPLVEAPEYGVHQLTTTLNPVRTQLYTISRVIKRAMSKPGLFTKIAALWESPAWLGEEADEVIETLGGQRPIYDPPFGTTALRLTLALFAVALTGVTVYRLVEEDLSQSARFLVLFGLGAVVYLVGMLLDGLLTSRQPMTTSAELSATETLSSAQ